MSEEIPQGEKVNESEQEYQPPSVLQEDAPVVTTPTPTKRAGRRKINIEFIEDKSRRHITFSKRKAGIMKKAYELSTLTGTQVLLLVASETGHVYTFATPKLQPLITKPEGKNLIQACLNSPETLQSAPNMHGGSQLSPTPAGYPQQDHPGISQPRDYATDSNPPQSGYIHHEEESKSTMPYGIHRNYDVKPFQRSSPSHHDHMESNMGYSYGTDTNPMNSGIRIPYNSNNQNAPSLPTLSDRGSFSNLPNHMAYGQFPHYSGPVGSSFPSHAFPSPASGLFGKASNMPTLPQSDTNM